jgi:hypothetical protein
VAFVGELFFESEVMLNDGFLDCRCIWVGGETAEVEVEEMGGFLG